jgi:hypothetical protein
MAEDLAGEAGAAETGVEVGVRSMSKTAPTPSPFIGTFVARFGGVANL